MAKPTKFPFTVTVYAPAEIPRRQAKRLLTRVIQSGVQDAANAPEDFGDPDAEAVQRLRIGNPTDPKVCGFAVVQEADGQVVGPVQTRPTLVEAIDLAVGIASEQTDAAPKKLQADLESQHQVSDPDGGWAVYVTELTD